MILELDTGIGIEVTTKVTKPDHTPLVVVGLLDNTGHIGTIVLNPREAHALSQLLTRNAENVINSAVLITVLRSHKITEEEIQEILTAATEERTRL